METLLYTFKYHFAAIATAVKCLQLILTLMLVAVTVVIALVSDVT